MGRHEEKNYRVEIILEKNKTNNNKATKSLKPKTSRLCDSKIRIKSVTKIYHFLFIIFLFIILLLTS